MPNWHESMQQTFEYRRVDPISWLDREQITSVTESAITRDGTTETLVSATLNLTEAIEECYIRIYLVTLQNGITERFPLATVLVQTPDKSFDGKVTTISLDAYSPLTELKENQPPLGYSLGKGGNIMDSAYKLCRENMRAPVIQTNMTDTLQSSFVANSDDTWLTYNKDLIATVNYTFDLDEMGQLLFAPNQEAISLQPVTTFDDGNSSILYPDITINRDMYGIPNVVEVIYSSGRSTYYARAENRNEDSPISIQNRGREIVQRITNPSFSGEPTEAQLHEYADKVLKQTSTLEYTVTYTHGYYPVRVGDCVLLNYEKAGLNNVKAKIISQTIQCTPGCPVSEKAIYTRNLWG